MNWIALTGETKDVVRDQNGVPVEWTILRLGENPICQEGRDGTIRLTAEGMRQILAYHTKKGEEIPIDSEHYLYELANQKKLDEGETLKLFYRSFKTISGNEVEKLLKDAIVIHCRTSYAQIKDIRHL